MAQVELIMPKMGESIMEATILKWVKNIGDSIELDETILEIATDKVDSEVPSPVSGVLAKILFQENDVVRILLNYGHYLIPVTIFHGVLIDGFHYTVVPIFMIIITKFIAAIIQALLFGQTLFIKLIKLIVCGNKINNRFMI